MNLLTITNEVLKIKNVSIKCVRILDIVPDILQRYLMDCGVPKEFSHHLANEAALRLGDWIEANCIKKCDYECIRRSNSNGYCTLCSFMIQALPCPKNNEISFARIQLNPEELQCKRR